ncbi:MAG TPA: recombinase family protein [Bryobacteraceae bacterium]|jgi:site-specific DNA recombinase|nr:recombinase family protein [Bryobacteraceae bacterium]
MILRCAIYARYSSDLQSPMSIADQVRMCREYAALQGWSVLEEYIYSDAELSGAGADRPGLQRLLKCTHEQPRKFDVILIDDTSRLSRRQADQSNIVDHLRFAGIRLISVSQGIDSGSDQGDVLLTVHGLVDSLYIKELAKKTHRGLEGRALSGMHTGGRCFGFRNESSPDGVRLVIDDQEASIVRRIFETSASGISLKGIARMLNAERVPPPRARKGREHPTWCPTAIRAMLRNELYLGRILWNRSQFVKHPGTNRRVKRARPKTEWRTAERPELQIISDDLWQRVQERLRIVKELFGRAGAGINKASSSNYLLSGFLKCGLCNANMIIVAGKGRKTLRKYYGCPQHFNRGACINAQTIRQDVIERNFFSRLQREVLTDEVLDYTTGEFVRRLQEVGPDDGDRIVRDRKKEIERELQRLTAAIAEAGHSRYLIEAVSERERELERIEENLLIARRQDLAVSLHHKDIRGWIASRLSDLCELLKVDTVRARAELAKHTLGIRLIPEIDSAGKPSYFAEGVWDLLGTGLLCDGCGGWI